MFRKHRAWKILLLVIALLASSFFIYTGSYYRADEKALNAMTGDETVAVLQMDDGWLFDGPSDDQILVFYPGGKVEEKAYAPLMRRLAENGIDAFLLKAPFRLAILNPEKADRIIDRFQYDRYFVGGHSLGGAVAGIYAEANSDKTDGLILLAAYTTSRIDDDLLTVSVYGSNDTVLNQEKYKENLVNVSARFTEHVIEGGNHSQFGSYGLQNGDRKADISFEKQIEETCAVIIDVLSGQ